MARALVKNASNANPSNLLINGAFDFWQRATSFSSVTDRDYNSADRFMVGCSGSSSACLITRSTTVPNSLFKYSCQQVENGDAIGNQMLAAQRIEASIIRPYIGKTMTLSLWVRFTGALPPGPTLVISTPVSVTDDSWVSANPLGDTIQFTSPTLSLTLGTWSRVSYSFVVPSAATNGLQVMLSTNSYSSTPTMNHTGWMLTEGASMPSSFYRAASSIGGEFSLCERYYRYQQSTTNWMFPIFGRGFSTNEIRWNIHDFIRDMRTIDVSVIADGTLSIVSAAGAAPTGTLTTLNTATNGGRFSSVGLTGVTSSVLYYMQGAGTFRCSAEL